jgi:hypothetical protein
MRLLDGAAETMLKLINDRSSTNSIPTREISYRRYDQLAVAES